MTAVVGKRSVMTLYSSALGADSHRCRIVLAEKGVNAELIDVDLYKKPKSLIELNPFESVPTLVDRDLVLYHPHIIQEFLDERFPHPPLMPVYPVARARCRLMLHRIEQDWFSKMALISYGPEQDKDSHRAELANSIIKVEPLLTEQPFFMSEEFSLLDCALSVLLWRLDWLRLPLKPSRTLRDYSDRMFQREAFKQSLTEAEREIGGL